MQKPLQKVDLGILGDNHVEVRVMPLYWLCYRHNNSISVVIEPAHSLIYARLRTSLDGSDQGDFTEGDETPSACGRASRDYVFVGPEL